MNYTLHRDRHCLFYYLEVKIVYKNLIKKQANILCKAHFFSQQLQTAQLAILISVPKGISVDYGQVHISGASAAPAISNLKKSSGDNQQKALINPLHTTRDVLGRTGYHVQR